MASGSIGSSLTSETTELIVLVNDDVKSYIVTSAGTPVLFVDGNHKFGINTIKPGSQAEIASSAYTALRLRRGTGKTVGIDVDAGGDLSIAPSSGDVFFPTDVDILAHVNGDAGLRLGGAPVTAAVGQLGFNVTAMIGTAEANKSVIVDVDRGIAGINNLTASKLAGELQTDNQAAITNVGTLVSLTVANDISASTLTGVITTANQPMISSIGLLSSLTVTGAVNCLTIEGEVHTSSQPNITSIGELSSLTINGATVKSEASFMSGITIGISKNTAALSVGAGGSISGLNKVSATRLSGTIQTPAQPNIKELGTLSSLTVMENVSAVHLSGELQTPTQTNITLLGRMPSISIGGVSVSNELQFLSGVSTGVAAAGKAVALNSTKDIAGIMSISAASIDGVVHTANQRGIASLGTLSSLTVGGSLIGAEAAFLSGVIPGTAAENKAILLDGSRSIDGITALNAITLTGLVKSASQTNITSIGTQTSLQSDGDIIINSITDSTSTITGSLKLSGAAGVAKNLYVGTGIYGAAMQAQQPYITQTGTLTALTVTGTLALTGGNITINGTPVIPAPAGTTTIRTTPTYATGATLGTATLGKILALDASGAIASISSFSANTLAGAMATAAQPLITQLGSLTSLTVTGNAACAKIGGTLDTATQALITSVGSLTSLDVSGAMVSAGTTNATSAEDGGNFTVFGGMAVGKDAQLGAKIEVKGGLIVNGKAITGIVDEEDHPDTSTGASTNYELNITPGVAASQKCVVVDAELAVSGINSVQVNAINTNGTFKSMIGFDCTPQPGLTGSGWQSVCWSPQLNLLVAVAQSGSNRIATSPDGITWTPRVSVDETATWTCVIWAAELSRFVAIAKTGTVQCMYSGDGITWMSSSIYPAGWTSLAWNPKCSRFIAVSYSGASRIDSSVDGITWVRNPSLYATYASHSIKSVAASPYGLGTFVACCDGGIDRIIVSNDGGVTWNKYTSSPTSLLCKSITYSPALSRFVMAAQFSSNPAIYQAFYSTTEVGNVWARLATTSTAPYIVPNHVTWADKVNLFIAVGGGSVGGSKIMISADGINWHGTPSNSAIESTWVSSCYCPEIDTFVAVASSGVTMAMTSKTIMNSFMNLLEYPGVPNQLPALTLGVDCENGQLGYRGSSTWRTSNDSLLMRVDPSGNVGLYNSNPAKSLDLASKSSSLLALTYNGTKTSMLSADETNALTTPSATLFTSTSDTALTTDGDLTAGSAIFACKTASSKMTVGSLNIGTTLLTTGGMSIGGDIYVASTMRAGLTIDVTNTTPSTTPSDGSLIAHGSMGIVKRINANEMQCYSTTVSTTATTGAMIVAGGLAVGKTISVGALSAAASIASTSTSSGACVVASGGVGIGGSATAGATYATSTTATAFVANTLNCRSTYTSTGKITIQSDSLGNNATTGALIVVGDVGMAANLNVSSTNSEILYALNDFNTNGKMTTNELGVGPADERFDPTTSLATIVFKTTNYLAFASHPNGGYVVSTGPITNGLFYVSADGLSQTAIPFNSGFSASYITILSGGTPTLYVDQSTGMIYYTLSCRTISGATKYSNFGLWKGTLAGISTLIASGGGSGPTNAPWVNLYYGVKSDTEQMVAIYSTAIVSQTGLTILTWGGQTRSMAVGSVSTYQITAGGYLKSLDLYVYMISDSSFTPSKLRVFYGKPPTSSAELAAFTWTEGTCPSVSSNYVCSNIVWHKYSQRAYASTSNGGIWSSGDGKNWQKTSFASSITGVNPTKLLVGDNDPWIMGFIDTLAVYSIDGIIWFQKVHANFTSLNMAGQTADDRLAISNASGLRLTSPIVMGRSYGMGRVANGYTKMLTRRGYEYENKSTSIGDGAINMILESNKTTLSGRHLISDGASSTATAEGALVVSGGVGVALDVNVGGDGTFGGSIAQASDRRLKTDISGADMETVYKLYSSDIDAVTYQWKCNPDAGETVGVIAQDLVKHGLRDLVCSISNPAMEEGGDTLLEPKGWQWCVNYAAIAAYNMKMIQQLLKDDADFKSRLGALERARS